MCANKAQGMIKHIQVLEAQQVHRLHAKPFHKVNMSIPLYVYLTGKS